MFRGPICWDQVFIGCKCIRMSKNENLVFSYLSFLHNCLFPLKFFILWIFQIVGAFWYLLAVDRNDTCWKRTCKRQNGCNINYLYCGNEGLSGYGAWSQTGSSTLQTNCSADGDGTQFDFGIFKNALSSGIVSSKKFISKYCYCLWWGLQNLR